MALVADRTELAWSCYLCAVSQCGVSLHCAVYPWDYLDAQISKSEYGEFVAPSHLEVDSTLGFDGALAVEERLEMETGIAAAVVSLRFVD